MSFNPNVIKIGNPSNLSAWESYEIIKKYDLKGVPLEDTFTWDGETNSDILIKGNIYGSDNNIVMRFNGDKLGNYSECYHWSGYWSSSNQHTYGETAGYKYIRVAPLYGNSYFCCTGNLKKGTRRKFITCIGAHNNSYSDRVSGTFYSSWNNTVDPITSIQLTSSGNNITGIIGVYRLININVLP